MKKPNLKRLNLLKKRVEHFSREIVLNDSLYEKLIGAICSQQLSLKAAATIHGRFKDLFPDRKPTPETCLKLKHQTLRAVGLSEAKSLAVMDLSRKALEGVVPTDEMPLKMNDEELIKRLVAVRGIGKWTVEMILMFRYRRPDVWPVDDLGVQKGFRILFPEMKFKNAKELAKLGDFWQGNRSEIAWYCWRVLELEQKENLRSVPLVHNKKKIMLWVRGNEAIRIDKTRTAINPRVNWPGVISSGKARSSFWQKKLDLALKEGHTKTSEILKAMNSSPTQA